jgi:hypothetical protein
MDGLPIGDYALLSDCRSAALVSWAGSVDWLCFPRFDAPSVFCRLLDPAGGRFAIRPAGDFRASRAYLDQTMVLETTFRAETGTAVLTDALAVGRNDRGHHLGPGRRGSCCAGCSARTASWRSTSPMRRVPSTDSSTRSWRRSRAAWPRGAAPAGSCFPGRSVSSSTGPPPPRACAWPLARR